MPISQPDYETVLQVSERSWPPWAFYTAFNAALCVAVAVAFICHKILSYHNLIFSYVCSCPILAIAMDSEYITISPALLNFRGSVISTSDSNDAVETFDAQQVAIGRARRALSVNLGGLGGSRGTGLETNANAFPIVGAPRSSRDETTVDPRNSGAIGSPPGPSAVSIGTLARSNATSRRTSTVSTLRPPSAEQPGLRKPPPVAVSDNASQNTHIFQSLDNYRFPGTAESVTQPLPVFTGRDYGPEETQAPKRSIFGSRSGRGRSASTWVPGLDVIRRASVALEDAVKNISSVVRRSTLSDIYEKAKVRQEQLQRSTIAQVGFQYTFYILILASIYFVLVGVPLWKGVVWGIYIIFNSRLAVPAGTGVFLGIGFLYAVFWTSFLSVIHWQTNTVMHIYHCCSLSKRLPPNENHWRQLHELNLEESMTLPWSSLATSQRFSSPLPWKLLLRYFQQRAYL